MGCTSNGVSFDDTERAFVFNGAAASSLSLTNPVGNVFSVSFDVRYTGGCSGAPSHWPRGCGLLAAEATSDREYYLGCFSHDLTTDDIVVSNFDECRSECAGRGHAYCALQEGSRCFCTDSYGGVIVVPSPEAECPENARRRVCPSRLLSSLMRVVPHSKLKLLVDQFAPLFSLLHHGLRLCRCHTKILDVIHP